MGGRWSVADARLITDLNLLESVISGYVELVPSGPVAFRGRCPFHDDRLSSLMLRPEHQSFHCFGCGAVGDVVAFVMRVESISHPQALDQLADRIAHRPGTRRP